MGMSEILRDLAKAKGLCLSDYRVDRLASGIPELANRLYDTDSPDREAIFGAMEDEIARMAPTTLLVTGGAGFIGSNLVKYILKEHEDYRVIVLDKLNYSGNLNNLKEVDANPRFTFVEGDICNSAIVDTEIGKADIVVNCAGETNIDRSIIYGPIEFINSNFIGTLILLEASRRHNIELFIQNSTDAVYGSIEVGSFKETDALRPRNYYSLCAATADLAVLQYYQLYNLSVTIARASNIYGPNQYLYNLIPLCVTNAIEDKQIPIHGDGKQIRDWLYVEDYCRAMDLLLKRGAEGEIYNIGAGKLNEKATLEVCQYIIEKLGKSEDLIKHTADRPGNDRRYSLNSSKICDLGWERHFTFEDGIEKTVEWYLQNEDWWRGIKKLQTYQEFCKKRGSWSVSTAYLQCGSVLPLSMSNG